MKPMGPIPPEFAGQAPLHIAGRSAEEWLAGHDGPVFVYDMAIAAARVAPFRAAMPPEIQLHYAMKANPMPALVGAMAAMVDGLDVASAGELAVALAHKPAHDISFAGPGKRDAELAAAIKAGATINLESAGEMRRALVVGERLGITPHLAVRVNPDMELRGSGMKMGGRASPFGIDAEQAPAVVREILASGADWQGLHIYAGSQALDADALIETQAATIMLAERLTGEIGRAPPLVNLGGGFGVPYFAGNEPLDIARVGEALPGKLDGLASAGTRFAIELGRWLVAECGVYLTRIVDRKVSRGETFLVVDGGLHHQLAASGNFGTVVRRNYPVAIANAAADAETEVVTIVGCLCTPLDLLADKVVLPVAQPGDVVAIFMAGAYGLTASPTAFLGHPMPAEILTDSRHS